MKDLIDKWKKNGAWGGIIAAPVIWFIVLVVVSTLFYSCESKAGGWWFPDSPEFFIYADIAKDTAFCEGGGTEISSNAGLRQALYKNDGIKVGIQYTHHSCAFLRDKNVYDAVGFGVSWKP